MDASGKSNQEAFEAAVNALKAVQHKITADRRAFNERLIQKWSPVFAISNISNIKADDFATFTLYSENQHWMNIYQQKSNITANLEALRRTLSILLDESRDISSRIDEIDPPRGQTLVRGFGKAVYTAILAIAYPHKYPALNPKTRTFLRRFGLCSTRRVDPSSAKYEETIEKCSALAKALDCSLLELDDLFQHVLDASGTSHDTGSDNDDDSSGPRIWVISTGEDAAKWDEFKNRGIVAIGWSKLGNLEQYRTEKSITAAIKEHYRDKTNDSRPMNDTRTCYDFAYSIAVGDTIVAKQGLSKILGIGKITSDYRFESETTAEWRNQRTVTWLSTGIWTLPDNARVPAKTLTEVTNYENFTKFLVTLLPEEKLGIQRQIPVMNFTGFSAESFQILGDFRSQPTIETYTRRKEDFYRYLAKPMELLIKDLAPIVAEKFGSEAETQRNILSRILKNDYGRGGIHFHYWMAFYPKGYKRNTGAQLFVYIHPEFITAGFGTGGRARECLDRLKKSIAETEFDFSSYLDHLSNSGFHIAQHDESATRDG